MTVGLASSQLRYKKGILLVPFLVSENEFLLERKYLSMTGVSQRIYDVSSTHTSDSLYGRICIHTHHILTSPP
jgi:hypothetical protein